ncbi:MAG: hypothetical protein M1522_07730 [Actinobacteria bacterium]|jgi:hypothetical protein|nr:hypothetical protein [Actinomycetota bacterium]
MPTAEVVDVEVEELREMLPADTRVVARSDREAEVARAAGYAVHPRPESVLLPDMVVVGTAADPWHVTYASRLRELGAEVLCARQPECELEAGGFIFSLIFALVVLAVGVAVAMHFGAHATHAVEHSQIVNHLRNDLHRLSSRVRGR